MIKIETNDTIKLFATIDKETLNKNEEEEIRALLDKITILACDGSGMLTAKWEDQNRTILKKLIELDVIDLYCKVNSSGHFIKEAKINSRIVLY